MSFSSDWSRRTFLKASLLTALALGGGQAAWAREELLTERPSVARLALYNTHTSERLDVTFRDEKGKYDQPALDELNWLLRCHYTDEVTQIDTRTLEYLSHVDRLLGGGHEIHIISAFRSPTYNELLRNRGRHVAKNSLHLQGRALDVRIPGVQLAKVRQAALGLAIGGVGYYPSSDFVHLDSGQFRTW